MRDIRNLSKWSAKLILAVALGGLGCSPEPPPHITDPGQLIYLGYKDTYASCARCHGDEGQGGMDAPEIRNSISEYGREEVRHIIVHGEGTGKKKMPAFGRDFTEEEIEQILDFITHWGVMDTLSSAIIDSADGNKKRHP